MEAQGQITDQATEAVSAQVSLIPVMATVRVDGEYEDITELGSETSASLLREAAEQGDAVWLELGMTDDVDRDLLEWYEGSIDAWKPLSIPEVDWSPAAEVLQCLGLSVPRRDWRSKKEGTRVLRGLPHLYARGVDRIRKDVFGRDAPAEKVRLFPTVGFLPLETPDGASPEFWTVRACVGVIEDCVITIRLPDLLCKGRPDEAEFRTGVRELKLPKRFLPFATEIAAEDLAESIALHQAATARGVSDRARRVLRAAEQTFLELERESAPERRAQRGSSPPPSRDKLLEALECVTEVTETVYQLDRQISRLLRRFGTDNDVNKKLIPEEIKTRYSFALDELRSLQEDCKRVSDVGSRAMATHEQTDREQFHFAAALLGAVILIPTLVAAVYGANVELPARGSWDGFFALLLFIVAFAGAGGLGFRLAWSRGWVLRATWAHSGKLRWALAIFSVLCLLAGAAISKY